MAVGVASARRPAAAAAVAAAAAADVDTAALPPVAPASAPVSAAAHASSVRTVRSLKRKLSNSLSPQNGPAAADAGLRAQLSETREGKAKVEDENEQLRDALKATKRQLTQSRHYRKGVTARARDAEHDANDLRAELAELTRDVEERIMCAYEQYEMESIVDEANSSNDNAKRPTPLVLMHDGRYDDALRAVIYAYIRAGVGKDHIAQLVAVTIELLANRRIDKLPSPATIARMATELNTLTHVQLYDLLTVDPTAITVFGHDGTTKSGKKIGAGVVHIDRSTPGDSSNDTTRQRESVALFVREQADGTAQSNVRALTDALDDVNAVGKLVFSNRAAVTANFHGVLSDHNVTERKTNAMVLSSVASADVKKSVEMLCWNHKYACACACACATTYPFATGK